MAKWPYEYGSDLHWLWGWGNRLAELLDDPRRLNTFAWTVFRPDRQARDAMIRFAAGYPEVVRQVNDALALTETRYAEFCADAEAVGPFADAMETLQRRIDVAAKAIADAEKPSGEQADADGWIPAHRAESQLRWTHKQLLSFAAENPNKLKTRKPSKQRLEVWAADVFKLEAESGRHDFDALQSPAADNLPTISESGMEKLAARLSQARARKAPQ